MIGNIIGAVAGGLLGKSGGGSQQVSNEPIPWSAAAPQMQYGLDESRNLYDNFRQMYYPGETVAPLNQYQTAGANYMQGYAGSVQPYINQSQGMSSFMQSPAMLNVGQNPYVRNMGDAIGNQMARATNKVMGNLRSGSVASGQLGGSRQALAQRGALQDMNQQYGDSLARLYGGAYGQGLSAVNQAQSMAPQMAQLGAYPGQIMGGIGDMYRGYDQQNINAARDRFNWYQTQPDQRLDTFINRVGGLGGRTMGTNQTTSGGGIKDILGGAMMGSSIGGLFGSNTSNIFNSGATMPSMTDGMYVNMPGF